MILLTWAFALGDLRGDEGNRTPNPCLAKAVLCQLSYVPGSAWGSTHAEGWRARGPASCVRPVSGLLGACGRSGSLAPQVVLRLG